MKTSKNQSLTLEKMMEQLRKYAPSIPGMVAAQLLSSLFADTSTVKNNRLLRSIFGGGLAIPALLLLAYVALKDVRDTTTAEFENELKSYAAVSKSKGIDNPFTVSQIGGFEQTFTNLDSLAESLGVMRIVGIQDRASRSFDAARRTAVLGWADPYLLRAAEFLAVRSIEQSMHEFFPAKPPKNAHQNWVTGITRSCSAAFKEDGEPKPGAEYFNDFLRREVQEIKNPHALLTRIDNLRDQFAHWDEAENSNVFRLDLAPFQLARVCLLYRNQARL
ncbi:hypothetical protein HMI48_00870 [Acidithiobacillus ferrooxidans]|uniref:hypothetical protein n=1 Tax=Acidithiobacillus ferrooxidans TaxID=920 RepID=UPI001C075C70|nr:hypothetical protein [Acidithiobacillus ferrooxidans]MBU2772514.1 hypothetical protein [Acidithiobacillus ferrooxidans]